MTGFRLVWASLRRRSLETTAAALAIGLVVAYLAAVGSFVAMTGAQLTVRAAAAVPVDWQVQVAPGSDPAAVNAATAAVPGVVGTRTVELAKVPGLSATAPRSAGGGTRTTGTAWIVGLPGDYSVFAPGELRHLLGATSGVQLQQQTAANLAAGVGDSVSILGGPAVPVAGVVDLPTADSFFQTVGAAAGAGASAPPDNVLIVPQSSFAQLVGNASVIEQIHVRFDHAALPHDPSVAASLIVGRANHLATSLAGSGLIGDNLAAALSGAREDALYARLLVWLLAVPGVVLGAAVAALVVALRTDRLRRELGVLRLRGAGPTRAGLLLGAPALLDGLLGAGLGTLGGWVVIRLALGSSAPVDAAWLAIAAGLGIGLAALTQLWPVARLTRRQGAPTVADTTDALPSPRLPWALRLGLDFGLLGASALVLWLSSRNGYQVVVVPEGVPVASVNYAALLAPAFGWPGLALLLWRITAAALNRARKRPGADPAGKVPDLRAAVVRRRRQLIARGATGLGAALALAVSTAVFTTTYDQQARLDVALTVGSDAAVAVPPDATTGLDPAKAAGLAGVSAVQPMLHRLTYVGPDLQDLYGIQPRTIGTVAPLSDAFTPGSSVHASLARLAATPDGALVSQETLHDYQLHTGDLLRLRLRDAGGTYQVVPFHVVGVVTEFATAPRDSFVVANYDYVARVTGSAVVQTLLVRTDRPGRVGAELRAAFNAVPAASVADTSAAAATVTTASGLAASDLKGLARLGVGFGALLALAAAVLALLVGARQRARSLTAIGILGASARQRAAFLNTEARALLSAGLVGGVAIGTVVAWELAKVLTGIFDPPPQHLAVPWRPLSALLAGLLAAGTAAVWACARWSARLRPDRLRDL